MSLIATVVIIPSHAAQIVTATIFVATAVVTATASKLPFSLSGEAEISTSQTVKLLDKLLTVVPTNALHRQVGTFKTLWVATHHSLP